MDGAPRGVRRPRQPAHQPGPGTAMEFALKLIDLLLGKTKAAEIAAQLVLIPGCTTIATVKKTELTC